MLNFKVAAVVVLIAVAAGWFRSEIKAAGDRREAQLMAEQTEIEFAALLDSIGGAWAVRAATWDSTHQALSTELEDQRGVARVAREGAAQVVLAARSRIRSLTDSLETLTAEDLEVIAVGIDSLETAEELCQGALGVCDELVGVGNARIFDLEAQKVQSLDLNRSQALTIDRLQNLRQPKIGAVGWLGYGLAAIMTVLMFTR